MEEDQPVLDPGDDLEGLEEALLDENKVREGMKIIAENEIKERME